MPASRSRTERWRESLRKIHERGGGIELAVDRSCGSGEPAKDLIFRVRVLELDDRRLVVELPGAMGRSFELSDGTPLLAIISVGQNRWMFHTRVVGRKRVDAGRHDAAGLVLELPARVERCQRRTFDRISTATIELPLVECWPLLDPASAIAPEVANRVQVLDLLDGDLTGAAAPSHDPVALPSVGPMFRAELANIGGGGVGLRLTGEHTSAVESARLFWLRIDLRPITPAPIAVTARLAHTHLDSTQAIYAGMAFEFGLNPEHRSFVVDQIGRYLKTLSRRHAA